MMRLEGRRLPHEGPATRSVMARSARPGEQDDPPDTRPAGRLVMAPCYLTQGVSHKTLSSDSAC
jgi:hypothetical protein